MITLNDDLKNEKGGEKSKPMTWKWKIFWSNPPLEWKEKVTWTDPPLVVKKKITWSDPPLVAPKKKDLKCPPLVAQKKRFEVPPIGGEKKSLELIPIGVKWPTIGNEKKVIRVTGHVSEKMGCEKTFHLKKHDLL